MMQSAPPSRRPRSRSRGAAQSTSDQLSALLSALDQRLPAPKDPEPEREKTAEVLAHEAEQLQLELRGKVKAFNCMADRCATRQMTNANGAVVIGCIPGLKETKGFCSRHCYEQQMGTWSARPEQFVMFCQQLARVREDTAAHEMLCEAVPPMKKGGGKGKKPRYLTACKYGKNCKTPGCQWMHK